MNAIQPDLIYPPDRYPVPMVVRAAQGSPDDSYSALTFTIFSKYVSNDLSDPQQTVITQALYENEDTSIGTAYIDRLKNEAINELNTYASFDPGWDGYTACTFEESVIKSAVNVVFQLSNVFKYNDLVPEEITPGPVSDGCIDIEIRVKGKYAIITLDPDTDKIAIYREWEERDFEFEEIYPDIETTYLRLLDWIIS